MRPLNQQRERATVKLVWMSFLKIVWQRGKKKLKRNNRLNWLNAFKNRIKSNEWKWPIKTWISCGNSVWPKWNRNTWVTFNCVDWHISLPFMKTIEAINHRWKFVRHVRKQIGIVSSNNLFLFVFDRTDFTIGWRRRRQGFCRTAEGPAGSRSSARRCKKLNFEPNHGSGCTSST